jgi:DNA-binding XRE family transcriptional regulator
VTLMAATTTGKDEPPFAASLASWELPRNALTTMLTVAPAPVHHCSCGLGFITLADLDEHLDRCGDDTDAHVQMALRRAELLARGLRRVRRERGLTMRDMADRLGMDVSTISRIEADRRGVTRWKPAHVAMDLGVPVEELLRACPACCYAPPEGFECRRCGTAR